MEIDVGMGRYLSQVMCGLLLSWNRMSVKG